MPPNTCKLETFDTFNTFDKQALLNGKSLFESRFTPLLSELDNSNNKDCETEVLLETGKTEDVVNPDTRDVVSNAYWDWCNDVTPQERRQKEKEEFLRWVFEEEANREFFSVEEVESRLVNMAKKTVQKPQTDTFEGVRDESYWAWSSGQDTPIKLDPATEKMNDVSSVGEVDYWGWHNDKTSLERRNEENSILLANLLLEEDIRISLSVNTIEKYLQSEIKMRSNRVDMVCATNEPQESNYWDWTEEGQANHEFHQTVTVDYWGWHNDKTVIERRNDEKHALLTNILLEEKIRTSFSVDAIEENLLRDSRKQPSEMVDCAQTESQDSNFWDW